MCRHLPLRACLSCFGCTRQTARYCFLQAFTFVTRCYLDAVAYQKWLKDAQSSSAQEKATVSVVVPTLNEEAAVQQLCQHLRTLTPQPHEIIIVDGGSTDRCMTESS